jgi:hypothetical protein
MLHRNRMRAAIWVCKKQAVRSKSACLWEDWKLRTVEMVDMDMPSIDECSSLASIEQRT